MRMHADRVEEAHACANYGGIAKLAGPRHMMAVAVLACGKASTEGKLLNVVRSFMHDCGGLATFGNRRRAVYGWTSDRRVECKDH